ncbi:MAG TPA: isochorismatase family cysteine hydrolase, partial [Deinococcales bacterium]|nr:isochorismatase family cysteine hydrolase [Deinococcales bacterium]
MPLTVLDPLSALIVIDLQRGIVAAPTAHPAEGVVANAARLADAFRRRGLPVVWVTVAGGAPGRVERARAAGERPEGWSDLLPELGAQPEDLRVLKRTWGAFTHTGLNDRLRELGVTQVVLA